MSEKMKDYLRYIYAVLAIPVVILTRFALLPLTGHGTPFITLFPATVIIALLGGMGPAILTGVLGVLISDYYFIVPLRSWDLGIEFWSRTAIVVLTSVFVGYVGAVLRQARSRAEEQAVELNRGREDLKRAQAVALTGSWRLDVRKDVLNWSDEAYRIFGVPAGTALTYESFLSYIHPDDRKTVDGKWQAALKGEKYDIEHRIVVDGHIKWVHEKAELEYEKDGTLSGGFGTVTDITERKKREKTLYRLNRTLRALSDSTQAMMRAKAESYYIQEVCDIIVKDCGYKMVWVGFAENDQAKSVRPVAFSGFEKGYLETLKITWSDTALGRGPTGTAIRTGKASLCRNVPADDAFKPWRAQALERGYASSISLPLISGQTAFGALTIYSTQTDPFSQDEIDLLTELTSDLSYGISAIRSRAARDEAQKALSESERKYRELVQNANSAIIQWNSSGKITLFNEYAQQFFGYSADEILGKQVDILLPQGQSEDVDPSELIQDIVNDPQRYANNINENVCKDGRRVWMAWTNKPVYDESGKVAEILAIGTDITQRKRMEEELRKSRDELEVRVKERTAQLDRTVSQLQRQVKQRIQAEQAATAERQRFNDVLETLPAYICLLTPDYYMPFANKVFRDLFGYYPDKKCYEFLFNRPEPCENCETYKVLETHEPQHWEWTGPNGRDYDIYDFPFKDTYGSQLILEMGIDVTERKRAESAVQAERQRLFDVLETLPAMICLLTPDYHVAFANRSFREKFGESHGRPCHEYCFGHSEPCDFCETFDVLKTGEPHHWEVTTPDGASVIDVYDFPFTDVDGSPLILEMDLDITEQKRAQAAVHAASRYARGLLEASLDPLVTISAEGKITDVNEATIKATGVAREQLIGTDFSNYFTEPDKAKEGYQRVFAKGFVTDYPLTVRHKDGRLTDVLYNATIYKNEAGEVQGVFAAARDITEKKATETELEKYRLHLEDLVKQRTEELARSNKDLEQFAYVASHDLQEPLRAVSGFVSLLERQLQDSLNAKTKEYMNFTVDGVARMQSLINGLLEYSRIDTRGKPPERTDSSKPLADAILSLQASIKESGAKITHDNLPTVSIDPVQLSQLFQNLISNAIKFRSESPPEIHVSAERRDNDWRFAVKDNGIGIEPQYAERIFMIFQRLHTRKKYPGTGIGLSLCKKIVERHGGKIWVESEQGRGSTFYFTVPDIEGA
jgi:PAS domain S-box-containing protein